MLILLFILLFILLYYIARKMRVEYLIKKEAKLFRQKMIEEQKMPKKIIVKKAIRKRRTKK